MNRRHKKKQQRDYFAQIQAHWAQVNWRQYPLGIQGFWQRLPTLHQRALMILIPLLLVLMVIPLPQGGSAQAQPDQNQRVEVTINATGLSEQRSQEQDRPISTVWHEYTVQQGDTLAQVFRNNDLPMADLNALVNIEGSDKPLSQIQQGQLIRFKLSDAGKLDILQLEKNNQSVMFFRMSDGGFGRSK